MTDTASNTKESMQKIVNIFTTGDLSEVASLFSSTYIDHQRPPWLTIDGPEEFKHIVLGARKALPNLRVTIEDCIAEGNAIAARLHWYSTQPGGKKIERETIDMLRFAQGKVIEHWGAETWRKEG
ncbi:ester cyclase [Ktedonosporobacter rubrisoli]|nr:ester cyclase [Ktedonosporobacter rubrisoli]